MNLKTKKIVLATVLACMILAISPVIEASANTITKYGKKEALSSPTTYAVFAWTGSTGGYVYAQVWLNRYDGTGDALVGSAGYNSWIQTRQVIYANSMGTTEGRHWSDAEYRVS